MSERYFLVEIDGEEVFLRGYVEGYCRALDLDPSLCFFGSDFGLDDESFLARMEAFFGVKVEHNLLVVPDGFRQHLEKAISLIPPRWGIRMTSAREVHKIRYPFKVATNNREVAGQFKGRVASLPEGAVVEWTVVQETSRSESFETSAYAPDHPYRYAAEGHLTGEVAATLLAYRAIAEFEVVRFGEPVFEFG